MVRVQVAQVRSNGATGGLSSTTCTEQERNVWHTFNACNQPYEHGYVNDHALRWLRPHLRRSTHEEASHDASWSVDPSCDRPSRPSRHRHATRNHLRHIIHQHQTTHSCILTHTIRRITGDLPYEPQLMRMSPVSSSIDQWEWAGY